MLPMLLSWYTVVKKFQEAVCSQVDDQQYTSTIVLQGLSPAQCYNLVGRDFGGSVGKDLPASEGDVGSIPGSGRSPGGGKGNLFQYSCLENSKYREILSVYGNLEDCTLCYTKSWTWLSTHSGHWAGTWSSLHFPRYNISSSYWRDCTD